ncbi:MAG: FAD-dependent monooxygenase [Flavobacteriales bacterium]|nr:FAD-dependent monooxygenase [Flavobacteriales bacterium]
MQHIVVAGAGLVGSLWATLLGSKGYKVTVVERRPDMRKANIPAGRSINLALSDRGWWALELCNLKEEVKSFAIPMFVRTMHDKQGNLTRQPYGRENEAIYSVSRGALNKLLLSKAETDPDIEFRFSERITQLDIENKILHLKNEETGNESALHYDVLFGCDGAYSAVRHRLQFTDRFTYSQTYIDHGYKELNMLPDAEGKHKMDVNTLHIWPRGEFMMIALPNPDGTFTCTLFLGWEGNPSFTNLNTESEVQSFFEEYFPDLIPLIPDYKEQFFQNPSSSLMMVKCKPWNHGKNIQLLGDAAHAIVPFYGQGMNAGFEDCSILYNMLEEHQWDFETVLPAFSKSHQADGEAIADLAMRNFVEMRDLTADPEFLFRKKVERLAHESFPEKWVPLYSMVTFSHTPYHVAKKEGEKQDEIMHDVLNKTFRIGNTDEQYALEILKNNLGN